MKNTILEVLKEAAEIQSNLGSEVERERIAKEIINRLPENLDDCDMEDNKNYERCVGCDKITNIKKTEHINNRLYYIEGSGQLCNECWSRIYNVE